jgi:hypothetical protein
MLGFGYLGFMGVSIDGFFIGVWSGEFLGEE